MTATLFFYWFLVVLFVFVSFCLVMLVLLQKGRGGGLSGAFGGGGGNTAFGAKTGDVLTWATSIIFGIFVILALLLSYSTGMVNNQVMGPAPVASVPATPAPAPLGTAGSTANPSDALTPPTQMPTTTPSISAAPVLPLMPATASSTTRP